MKSSINQAVTMLFLLLSLSVFSQKILIVEQPGTVNNKKYSYGSFINIKTNEGVRLKGHINLITDTSVVINYVTVNLADLKYVYINRRLVDAFSRVGTDGGLAYVGVDAFNGLINNDKPIFRKSALKIGAIMFGSGLVLRIFKNRRLHIDNKSWRVKVLDFSILKDPGVYDQLKKNEGD